MGKILSLVKNELIKQYKKTSIRVFLLIILAIGFGTPFLLKYMNTVDNAEDLLINRVEHEISWQQSSIDNLDKNAVNYEVAKGIYESNIQMNEFLKENLIDWNDWREDIVRRVNEKNKIGIAIKGLIDGVLENELLNNVYEIDQYSMNQYYTMDKQELQRELDSINEEVKEGYAIAKKNDYFGYLKSDIESSEAEIAQMKSDLAEIKSTASKKMTDEMNAQIKEVEGTLARREEQLLVTKYRYDNEIIFDTNDWKHLTLNEIENSIGQKYEYVLTEEQFNKSYKQEEDNLTYESYVEETNKRIKDAEETIKLDWYSLENNIPLVKFTSDARNSLKMTYTYYISLAVIICIIVGGSIMANEYSTGTIRLLMIRPVSRWKILLSKFLTVLIMGYVVIFIGFIANMISSGIVSNFSDYSIAMLGVKNGDIVESSFIFELIKNLMFASISVIFISAVAVSISTLVKNTAISVAVAMVVFFGSMPAVLISVSLGIKWIGKILLPYVNLASYINDSYQIQMLNSMGVELNPLMGVFELIVTALVLLTISFMTFAKRDITN